MQIVIPAVDCERLNHKISGLKSQATALLVFEEDALLIIWFNSSTLGLYQDLQEAGRLDQKPAELAVAHAIAYAHPLSTDPAG